MLIECNIFRNDTHRKRTVEDPNRSVNGPTFSSPIVMSGFRPTHIMSATIFPPTLLIFVRRLSPEVEGCICGTGEGVLEEEAIAFDCSPASDEDEKDSGAVISTVSISYALPPVATSTREVLSISAAVNLSSILEGNICDEVYTGGQLYMRAQTGGRFMISKLGIAFVLEYLNRKIITANEPPQSYVMATAFCRKNGRAEGFYAVYWPLSC